MYTEYDSKYKTPRYLTAMAEQLKQLTASDWIALRIMREMSRCVGMSKAIQGAETSRAVLWLTKKYGFDTIMAATDAINMARREEDKQHIERACRIGSNLMGDEPPIECIITELMENDF